MTELTVSRPPSSSYLHVENAPITLFGHSPSLATLELQPRARSWRIRKALPPLVATVILAPCVAVIPPHAPWVLATVGTGGFMTWRRWKEEYTIMEFEGRCPRCHAELHVSSGTRLRFPHSLACESCGHEPVLDVNPAELVAGAPATS